MHNVRLWRKDAEKASTNLKRGDKVTVIGKLKYDLMEVEGKKSKNYFIEPGFIDYKTEPKAAASTNTNNNSHQEMF